MSAALKLGAHVCYVPNLVEVAVVKDEEILVLVREALNGMRRALGEVPDVAVVEFLNLVHAVLIHDGELHLAGVDDTPLRLFFLSNREEKPGRRGLDLQHGASAVREWRPSSGAAAHPRCRDSAASPESLAREPNRP